MSWKASGRVWDLKLPHAKIIVLLAMADHADHDGHDIKPALGLVAWKTGYSERQVRRVIRSLEADGILKAQGKSDLGTTEYSIDFDAAPKKESYTRKERGRPEKPRSGCPPIIENPGHLDVRPLPEKTPDILSKTPDILALNPGHPDVRQTDNSNLNRVPPLELKTEQKELLEDTETSEAIVEAWNGVDGITKVRHLSVERKKHLRARLRDAFWRDHWREALTILDGIPFYKGQNDRKWVADFDWFLRPESVTKLIEKNAPRQRQQATETLQFRTAPPRRVETEEERQKFKQIFQQAAA